MNKIFLIIIIYIIQTTQVMAQNNFIDDTFRSSGKINVVVAVLSIIFAGIAFFLFRQERRINKLEKELENQKKNQA
ncbi:MAG: CcmD family protein [Bacteroidota bacterium]|nr:CcmD family protein [Bacteroidota bacterium]